MKFVNYVKEAYNELVHKVTWPTMSQLSNSAVIVMTASLIFAAVISVIDLAFDNLMQTVYSILY